MVFLGPCEACGQVFRTYRSLSQHLRSKGLDEGHLALKAKYQEWRSHYRSVVCCRRCKTTWEISDKSQKDIKLCAACASLRQQVGKRQYAKLSAPPTSDPRQKVRGRKNKWDGLPARGIVWSKDAPIYKEIVEACLSGEKVNDTKRRLGVSYIVYKDILQDAFGVEGYAKVAAGRKTLRSSANIKYAHAKWKEMTPDERAAEAQRRFGRGSVLEVSFANQIKPLGFSFTLNDWQSVQIGGEWRPREADLKVTLPDNRKIVILCDGEAFHGPKYIYGDPNVRVADDLATAEGYYALGYTVLRYSETEVKNGFAYQHFTGIVHKLTEAQKALRLWHPAIERFS